jgi:hypothetical protein
MEGFMIFLISLFSFCLSSFADELESSGRGFEILLAGAGQARLGSAGAVTSNPALLAWLPKDRRFISQNAVSYYKLRSARDIKLDIDIIPLYAVTSEGDGRIGFAYGLTTDSARGGFEKTQGAERTSSTFEHKSIRGVGGVGMMVSSNSALGLSVYLERVSSIGQFTYQTEDSGFEFLMSGKSTDVNWASGLSTGYAWMTNNWAFGLSSKFNIIKFGAEERSEIAQYSEFDGTIRNLVNHNVMPRKIAPIHSAGAQYKKGNQRIFADVNWVPAHRDSSMDANLDDGFAIRLGHEVMLPNELYRLYSGFAFFAQRNSSNGEDEKPAGVLSLGFSKKNKHSYSLMGVTWRRDIDKPGNELLSLILGTQFTY